MGCKCNQNIAKYIEKKFDIKVFKLQFTCENCQSRQENSIHMPKGKGFKWFSENYDKWLVWIEEYKKSRGLK